LPSTDMSKMSLIQAMEKTTEYIEYLKEQITLLDENDFKD